jgi:hypothetical protein
VCLFECVYASEYVCVRLFLYEVVFLSVCLCDCVFVLVFFFFFFRVRVSVLLFFCVFV